MPDPAPQVVELEIGDPKLTGPVLERLVSAAAARASLPVDRVVNAMTLVDALVHATDSVLDGSPRDVSLTIGSGSVELRVNGLADGNAEALRDAGELPGVGNVFERIASGVSIERDGNRSSLLIELE